MKNPSLIMEKSDEEKILKELREFAKENDLDAVYLGKNPESSGIIYYFLKGEYKFNESFEEELSLLEMKLFPDSGTSIMCFPVYPEQAKNYGFLGKCIYRKQ